MVILIFGVSLSCPFVLSRIEELACCVVNASVVVLIDKCCVDIDVGTQCNSAFMYQS